MFDGTAVDFEALAKPWAKFSAPLGSYFITGNHEQFSSPSKYLDAVQAIRNPRARKRKNYSRWLADRGRPLSRFDKRREVPIDPASSGPGPECRQHPARSQSQPFARRGGSRHFLATVRSYPPRAIFSVHKIVSRIYGKFAYGLNRFGDLAVYTSCGAGTWGPPMRLGSNPGNCSDSIRIKIHFAYGGWRVSLPASRQY